MIRNKRLHLNEYFCGYGIRMTGVCFLVELLTADKNSDADAQPKQRCTCGQIDSTPCSICRILYGIEGDSKHLQ